jgi:predicted outer membrane repeat protein
MIIWTLLFWTITTSPVQSALLISTSVTSWSELITAINNSTINKIFILNDIDAINPGNGIIIPYGRTVTIDGDFPPITTTPTKSPSKSPRQPSKTPSRSPSHAPSKSPSISPNIPTATPSESPLPFPDTHMPTSTPSRNPSLTPSKAPKQSQPSHSPTLTHPTQSPTDYEKLPPKANNGTFLGRRIINLKNLGRGFIVEYGATVTIQNLKIINGIAFNATELNSTGQSLLASKVKLHPDGISATYLNSVGGAIFNHGNLTLSNVMFSNNMARSGGAVFNWGSIRSITDCEFTNNSAIAIQYLGNETDPHWIHGQTRIMYFDYGRNQYWEFWSWHSYNQYGLWKAGNPGYPFLGGGAIAQPNVFREVYSESYNKQKHGLGPVIRTVFNRNTAIQRGGAIYISSGGALETSFMDCRFVSNSATYHPQRDTVTRWAEETMVVFGGGIALTYQQRGGESTIKSITNTEFEHNTVVNERGAAMGGAISISVSGGPGWFALGLDGILPTTDPYAVITSEVSNSETSNCCGGGLGKNNPFRGGVSIQNGDNDIVMNSTYQIETISHCRFTRNIAKVEGEPEAIWVYPAIPVEKSAGGAISSSGNIYTISSCTFMGNQAIGFEGTGGAIGFTGGRWNQMGGYDLLFDNFYEAHLHTITTCVFENNIASFIGGAIQADHGVIMEIRSVNFTNNDAGQRGGGMSLGTCV